MIAKEQILEQTLEAFKKKGLKFTMEDIANDLGISKKTIYKVFKDKEDLFMAMVDYVFENIKESEMKIMRDFSLTTVERLRQILIALLDSYKDVDFRQLYVLREKYPNIYKKVEYRIESGWENTIFLLEEGMREGSIRKISIPIFKTMMEATIEKFLQEDALIKSEISYVDALTEVLEILMSGILCKEV